MLTLLSPAKKLNMDPIDLGIPVSKPRLLDDTRELAFVAKKQTADDLKRLMHISDNLATINYERFQAFEHLDVGCRVVGFSAVSARRRLGGVGFRLVATEKVVFCFGLQLLGHIS